MQPTKCGIRVQDQFFNAAELANWIAVIISRNRKLTNHHSQALSLNTGMGRGRGGSGSGVRGRDGGWFAEKSRLWVTMKKGCFHYFFSSL